MSFSNNSSKHTKSLSQILTDLVNSLDGIYSGFCVDREGLLIEEVNLEGTLGKESSLILLIFKKNSIKLNAIVINNRSYFLEL